MDSNRVQLLTLIDSPFIQTDFAGMVTVAEAAEALYLLSSGPDALKPALDGRRAEFTVRALHFYEYHARGATLQEMSAFTMQTINDALAPDSPEPEEASGDNGKTNEEILAGLDPEKVKALQKKHAENLELIRQGKPTIKEKPKDG